MSSPVRPIVPVLAAMILAAAAAAAAAPGLPEQPKQKLEALKAELDAAARNQSQLKEKAEAVGDEIDVLDKKLVDAARGIQDREAAATELEDQIAVLQQKESGLAADLARRRAQLVNALAALQRLSQRPPELGITRPEDARTVVQSAELLSAIVPELKTLAAGLEAALGRLKAVREELKDRRGKLSADLAALDKQRADLSALLGERKKQRAAILSDAKEEEARARQIAREVTNVRRLIARLDEEATRRLRQKPERPANSRPEQSKAEQSKAEQSKAEQSKSGQTRTASAASPATAAPGTQPSSSAPRRQLKTDAEIAALAGSFNQPVSGRIVTVFGQEGPDGPSRGIRIETRGGAQVVAPYDGRIVFTGPFRDYGQLLIIRHADGYHSLLAGMARIDGQTGQWVVAGEPVGVMGAGTGAPGPRLYLEIRRNNEAVNPVRWLAGRKKKSA